MNRKFKLTKKKILSLAVIVALLAIAAMGTLAYFTDTGTAHNVITTGKIDITLNDKTIDAGVVVDFPEDGVFGVMPSETVDKIVSVTNNSAGHAWVRIRIEPAIVSADGAALPLLIEDDTIPAFTINLTDSEKWSCGADGCWYYTESLAPGATTDVLFDSVTFAFELGNEYQNCTATIDVTAEAVQTVNNPIPDGGTVEDIPGWPEKDVA